MDALFFHFSGLASITCNVFMEDGVLRGIDDLLSNNEWHGTLMESDFSDSNISISEYSLNLVR